jgi:hypothetical protein
MNSSKEVGVIYCDGYNEINGYLMKSGINIPDRSLYKELLSGNVKITTSSLLVKKSCLKSCGMWDTNLPSYIDYDLCLRLSQQYQFEAIDEPLVISTDHSQSSVSTNIEAKLEGLDEILDKWGDEMKCHLGENACEIFRTRALSSIYQSVAMYHLRNGRRVNGINLYLRYLKNSDSLTNKNHILALGTLIYPKSNRILKKYWFMINGNHRTDILSSDELLDDV